MNTETKFRAGISMSLLGLITMTFFYFQQQDELRKCQAGNFEKQQLIDQRDSLQAELFVRGVELGRYEIAFEMFKEKNKPGAEEFELILTTQTE
jgi:hypothetical protein